MGTPEAQSQLELDTARVAELLEEQPDAQVIDVHEPYEREAGHIEGTRHIELPALAASADSIERERPVVFYCRVGSRSQMAAQAFRTSGFDAYSMAGGLVQWVAEGRPLWPADGYVADH